MGCSAWFLHRLTCPAHFIDFLSNPVENMPFYMIGKSFQSCHTQKRQGSVNRSILNDWKLLIALDFKSMGGSWKSLLHMNLPVLVHLMWNHLRMGCRLASFAGHLCMRTWATARVRYWNMGNSFYKWPEARFSSCETDCMRTQIAWIVSSVMCGEFRRHSLECIE